MSIVIKIHKMQCEQRTLSPDLAGGGAGRQVKPPREMPGVLRKNHGMDQGEKSGEWS